MLHYDVAGSNVALTSQAWPGGCSSSASFSLVCSYPAEVKVTVHSNNLNYALCAIDLDLVPKSCKDHSFKVGCVHCNENLQERPPCFLLADMPIRLEGSLLSGMQPNDIRRRWVPSSQSHNVPLTITRAIIPLDGPKPRNRPTLVFPPRDSGESAAKSGDQFINAARMDSRRQIAELVEGRQQFSLLLIIAVSLTAQVYDQ